MSKLTDGKPAPADRNHVLFIQTFAWSLVAIVCTLAVASWLHYYSGKIPKLTAYSVFPLLGLLAYSLMWTHYVTGLGRRLLKLPRSAVARYFEATSWVVLGLICLHPGILIYQRFRDGYGLPPHSYETYVAPGLGWITILGSTSLLIFLAYELRRVYGNRPWWRYMQVATDVAMLAIFYHSLRLGSETASGWYRAVWWFYGLVLIGILTYNYIQKYLQHSRPAAISPKT